MFVNRRDVQIQWGDCDPAGIVFYPNFLRWMDAASLRYFSADGVATWHARAGAPLRRARDASRDAPAQGAAGDCHPAARRRDHRQQGRSTRRGSDLDTQKVDLPGCSRSRGTTRVGRVGPRGGLPLLSYGR